MSINITAIPSKNKKKTRYTFEWGKASGQRIASGIFTYNRPKDLIEKNHNKEALKILETKRSRMILDKQSIYTGYTPAYKIKINFLDFYGHYVLSNVINNSRHLSCSYNHFKTFLKRNFISASDITENLCENYRAFLLSKYDGETPANYFSEFKRVLKAGKRAGYFIENPAADLVCRVNRNRQKKEVIEPKEYIQLLKTPCCNSDVRKAFIFSLYTGLRWCDVKTLRWENVKSETVELIQNKTQVAVEIPLHSIIKTIFGERKTGLLFRLPTANGANKVLKSWCANAGLKKHITWHCARLSFSVLLQDEGINTATVAGMLGLTSTRLVEETYQRYRTHLGMEAIEKLPS